MGSKKIEDADTVLTEEELVKGLNQLDDFVSANDAPTRKDELLKKALGDELVEGERDELFKLMGGADTQPEIRSDEIVKSLNENENLRDAFEISDFLREQHGELVKSLGSLAGHQEHAETRQHEFNMILAKTVHNTGTLVKAMSERLGVIARQPARAPKSVQTRQDQVMQKSFADGSAQDPAGMPESRLNPQVIVNAMGDMLRKSVDSGNQGMSPGGADLSVATATFEQTKQVSPRLLAEIKDHLSSR